MRRSALVALGVKEFRALVPLSVACAITVAAGDLTSEYFLKQVAVLAYLFGSIALGAQSIGHEYGHGTLGTLLSLPVDRRRIVVVKFLVVAALIATLGLVASLTLFDERPFRNSGLRVASVVALCGLFLAPALTMLTRSWIAGSVFTIALPGFLWIGLILVGIARFGAVSAGPIDRFTEAVFWPAMYGICAIAAAANWWMFVRLEAIEGRGSEINISLWPRTRSAAAGRGAWRPAPMWQLVLKELHLHQMPFVLAGLYAAAVVMIAIARRKDPAAVTENVLVPLTILYVGGVSALSGAFASAEERQLGTHDWQVLVPVAAWKQWTVKAGIALGVTCALALGLPGALSTIAPVLTGLFRYPALIISIVALVTASALYVSSLSTSGLRALLVTFPALFVAGEISRRLLDWLTALVFRDWHLPPFFHRRLPEWLEVVTVAGIVCAVLLTMAFGNHRSGERVWQRIALQLASVVLVFVVSVVTLQVLGL